MHKRGATIFELSFSFPAYVAFSHSAHSFIVYFFFVGCARTDICPYCRCCRLFVWTGSTTLSHSPFLLSLLAVIV